MYLFYIVDEEVKSFMNKLLRDYIFDNFEVRNIKIQTFVKYDINCNLSNDYIRENKKERFFCNWEEIKPYIFQIIKGKKKPLRIKIIFSMPEKKALEIHNNAKALFLNLNFENDIITFTTGTSQINFSMNKEVDIAWEEYIKEFFKKHNIMTINEI